MLSSDSFVAIGSRIRVVVDEAAALAEAMAIVCRLMTDIDDACSRFRPDSELSGLNARAGRGAVRLSPLLEEALVAALRTAEITGGLVDPTVGSALEEIGYTVTFRDLPLDGPPLRGRARRPAGWRTLEHDPLAHTLRLPEGVTLDLGASGKAWAADRAAQTVATRLGVAVAVDCGGDIAIAGRPLADGWPVHVAPDEAADGVHVLVYDGGLATSGTTARRWRRGGVELHHVIDPATGRPADTPWAMVTVAGASCLDANAAATAALILGEHGAVWLDELGLPARLVSATGNVRVVGGWRAA